MSQVPLGSLRAFEAAARHLSFTRAADELCVTQAAISHQIKGLEAQLGVSLFRRSARSVALTDEGLMLFPVVSDALQSMAKALERFEGGAMREVLNIGVVGTFAVRWLLPRLATFERDHPNFELRLRTHNNKVDLAAGGFDLAVFFGDGDWPGLECDAVLKAPMTPLCAPTMAAELTGPGSLEGRRLLRSFRSHEWPAWFAAAEAPCPSLTGPVFDSAELILQAAVRGHGVALAPAVLCEAEIAAGALLRPFEIEVEVGGYWLARPRHRPLTPGVAAFRTWCLDA